MVMLSRSLFPKGLRALFSLFLLFFLFGPTAPAFSKDGPSPGVARERGAHELRLLNSGAAELEQRLRMIENAQESIEIETFAFVSDKVGQLLMQAITARQKALAAEGRQLKVKILVDNGPWANRHPDPDPATAAQLEKLGIHVRYYNRVEGMGTLFREIDRDSRTHRKIFVVDGKEMVSGGRNLGAADFGLGSEGVNYVDVGVHVKGPVAARASDTFHSFWDSAYSSKPEPAPPTSANPLLLHPPAASFVEEVRAQGSAALKETVAVPAQDISLVSSSPAPSRNRPELANYFHQRLREAKSQVLLENYLYIPTKRQLETEKALLDKGVTVELLTNGIGSSGDWRDHWELSFPYQAEAAKRGVEVLAYRGERPAVELAGAKKTPPNNWMIHAKLAVIDDKHTWIGTNNMDPRSENLNAEWAIVVNDNPAFAAEMKKRILANAKKADRVMPEGKYELRQEVEGIPCVTGEVKAPEVSLPEDFVGWIQELAASQVRKAVLINEY